MDKIRISMCCRCRRKYPRTVENFPRLTYGYQSAVCADCLPKCEAEDKINGRLYQMRAAEIKHKFDTVYFAQRTNQYGYGIGLIKIGFSGVPDDRVANLRREYKDKSIQILGVMHGGWHDEQALHKRFERMAVGKEWFLPGNELTRYIKKHTFPLSDYVIDRDARLAAINAFYAAIKEAAYGRIWGYEDAA